MSVPLSATVAGVLGVAGVSYYLSKRKREMPSKEEHTTAEVADIDKITSDTEIDSEVDGSIILQSDLTLSGQYILFVFNPIDIGKTTCFKGLAECIAQKCSSKVDGVSDKERNATQPKITT